jgi:ubiquitin carboxyl-terminal hydrolase 36/42
MLSKFWVQDNECYVNIFFFLSSCRYGITGGKVTRHITFPEVLDVRPYVSTARGSNSGARAAGDPDDSNMAMEYKYRLYGVLVHEGHSTSSGHYYCYVSTSNGAWYCMNDHMVSFMLSM